jgi:putative intracellular protease/amidase
VAIKKVNLRASTKKLHPDAFREELQNIFQTFVREAKTSAAVCSHPNVVTTFGLWMEQELSMDSMIVMGNHYVTFLM